MYQTQSYADRNTDNKNNYEDERNSYNNGGHVENG